MGKEPLRSVVFAIFSKKWVGVREPLPLAPRLLGKEWIA
jgi:hypothetical protein